MTATVDTHSRAESAAIADGQHLARGAAANLAVLLAANFRGVFTFLIARLLGEAALGRFSLVFTTTDLLSKIGMLGLDSAVVPLVAKRAASGDRAACRRVLQRAVVTAGAVSVAVAIVAFNAIQWLGEARGLVAFAGGAGVMLLALPGIAAARIATGVSRGLMAMRSEFYSRGLTETWMTIGVFVIAVALGLRDQAPAVAVVAGTTAAGVVALALAARLVGDARHMVAAEEGASPSVAEMLRFSAPIAASSLLNVLVMRFDVLLLGLYVGHAPGVTAEAFGVFCATAEIAGGMRKVRQVFDPILAPVVATRMVRDNRARLRETVAGPGRWVLSAQLPVAGALLLGGGALLSLYGANFRQGALWLAILTIAHGTNSFAGLVETLLTVERPGLNLVNAASTVLIQLGVGVWLIPRLGILGGALAMLAGFVAQGVLRFVEVRHVFGWSWPWVSLKRPLAAFCVALVPAGVLKATGAGLAGELAATTVFLAVYVGTWWVLGADPDDREVWRRLFHRAADAAE